MDYFTLSLSSLLSYLTYRYFDDSAKSLKLLLDQMLNAKPLSLPIEKHSSEPVWVTLTPRTLLYSCLDFFPVFSNAIPAEGLRVEIDHKPFVQENLTLMIAKDTDLSTALDTLKVEQSFKKLSFAEQVGFLLSLLI